MTDILSASRFITVAGPSKFTDDEYRRRDPSYQPRPPVHQDYALMKVLFMLRLKSSKARYPVHLFQYDEPVTALDFSTLEDKDVIFIVGHGSDRGLYTLGPDADKGLDRLVQIITKDGNLKRKRKDKEIVILLLSCRAGLGLHKSVARRLFTELGRDLTVGGAIGFTFGSPRTSYLAMNEVLIRGIPWYMEYPSVYKGNRDQAEKETSAREGKEIKYADKEADIEKFKEQKKKIEDGFQALVKKLKSTEVNKALDEIEKDFRSEWLGLAERQFNLYALAKQKSNLEFDMWEDKITDGYVWTTGKKTTAADAALTGDLILTDNGASSVK